MSLIFESPVDQFHAVEFSSSSSHQAVAPIFCILSVTELCENIVQHLSFQDLIRTQLVCRDLNGSIKSSPACQTTLFYRPTPRNGDNVWVADYKQRLFVGDNARPYLNKIENGSRNWNFVNPIICNPILISRRSDDIRNSKSKRTAVAVGINDHFDRPHHDHEHFELGRDLISKMNADSSCRSMFLTQPPVTLVKLDPVGRCEHTRRQDAYLRPGWCDQCAGNRVISNRNGVTIGQVVDEAPIRGSQDKNAEADKIRFSGSFVISLEVLDLVNEAEAARKRIPT